MRPDPLEMALIAIRDLICLQSKGWSKGALIATRDQIRLQSNSSPKGALIATRDLTLACQRFVNSLSTSDDPVDSAHPRDVSIVES